MQNGSRLQLAHVIFEHYRTEYTAAFPDWPLDPNLANYKRFPATGSPYTDSANWNSLSLADKEIINRILVNYGKAIEAYLRKLVSRDAPFDRFVAGDREAISRDAQAGAQVVRRKGGVRELPTTRRSSLTTTSMSSGCTSTRACRPMPSRASWAAPRTRR